MAEWEWSHLCIMGFFWSEGDTRHVYDGDTSSTLNQFFGRAAMYNEGGFHGRFSGAIRDQYGKAYIEGEISPSTLRFERRYFVKPGGKERARIHCALKLHRLFEDSPRGIPVGWKGVWQTEGGAARGEVACLLFPKPKDATVDSAVSPRSGEGAAEPA